VTSSSSSAELVQVTLTGHAGLHVQSGSTSVLCDPWFTPAYFASWFPFPDNAGVDPRAIGSPTYLYISHLHRDHFDARYLAAHVAKDAVVLLPEFPLDELRRELEGLGFSRFIQTVSGVPVDLDGVGVTIHAATTPADGPLGDSALSIDDGNGRVLDQNDCHLPDPSGVGTHDLHLLQFSGAIWYPMVYRYDPGTMRRLSREKRANQLSRATRYIEAIGARAVVPFAGPPAFLDDDLFHLNDLGDDPGNIFLDQSAFIAYLAARGINNTHLMGPGSTAEVTRAGVTVTHPGGSETLRRAFADKKAYLEEYRERRRPEFEAVMAACPTEGPPIVAALQQWLEPLLDRAPRVCAALAEPVVLDLDGDRIVIDPVARQVRPWAGEAWGHLFALEARLVRSLIVRRSEDWVNDLFLSCRFEAERQGPYNGVVFQFFKCLSPARMDYLEASLVPAPRGGRRVAAAAQAAEGEDWRFGDYVVQRRCPHLGGDLARFGDSNGRVLTCTLHGWQFDLETGRCLNAAGQALRTARVPAPEPNGTTATS
jgi:UDP-MurNAc hydroxylase